MGFLGNLFGADGNASAATAPKADTGAGGTTITGDQASNLGNIVSPNNIGEAWNKGPGENFSNNAQQLGGVFKGISADFTAQNPFLAQLAPLMQSNYGPILQQAASNSLGGQGAFGQNMGLQQALAAQLMAQGMGQGPNPALNQLAQTTGQTVANQAALAAGQRGSGSNVGLMARQAAQQGANVQQQATGQAATLAAQQQLQSQNLAGGLLGNVGSQIIGNQQANNQLFGQAAGAQNNQNTTQVSNYGMAQNLNQNTAQNNANAVNKTMGGLVSGAGSALMALLADGGRAGDAETQPVPVLGSGRTAPNGPSSRAGQWLSGMMTMQSGGPVPGQAKVAGNSTKNDVVPALLSPDEIVIPRSHSQDPDKAAAFARAVVMRSKKGKKC